MTNEPWRDLPMPTKDEIADALAWIGTMPDGTVAGCYLSGLEDDDSWLSGEDYCERHALAAARRLRRTSPDVRVALCDNWDGVDGERWCSGKRCRRQLRLGHFTDYGIDSAVGITEEDPCNVALTIHGLQNAADSLVADDPRWRLWMFHVDHLRAEAKQ